MLNKRKNLQQVLESTKKENRAIGQFNFSSLEQLKAITKAAKELETPIICGTSPGESNYFGIEEAVSLVRTIEKKENILVYLNYDHGKDVDIIKKAVDCGYDMVHFDGSHLTFEENIEKTKEVVAYAHKKGVVVEGEISKIPGRSIVSTEEVEEIVLTPIEKVVRMIKETKVDCIAFDVGSFHGIHKNKPEIYPERVAELLSIVNPFIALHGGSGIDDEMIKILIKKGVTKININTELRFQWRNSLYQALANNEEEITPYNIFPAVVDAVYRKTKEKIKLFNYAQNNF